jgi:hypothetical protein
VENLMTRQFTMMNGSAALVMTTWWPIFSRGSLSQDSVLSACQCLILPHPRDPVIYCMPCHNPSSSPGLSHLLHAMPLPFLAPRCLSLLNPCLQCGAMP